MIEPGNERCAVIQSRMAPRSFATFDEAYFAVVKWASRQPDGETVRLHDVSCSIRLRDRRCDCTSVVLRFGAKT